MANRVTFRERVKGLAIVRLALELGFTPQVNNATATKHFYFDGPGELSANGCPFSVHFYRYSDDAPTFAVGHYSTSSEIRAIELIKQQAELGRGQ